MRKRVLFLAIALLAASTTFAQDNGMTGITKATNMITGYFDPATRLTCATDAVADLIGDVKVCGRFSSGDLDASKMAVS